MLCDQCGYGKSVLPAVDFNTVYKLLKHKPILSKQYNFDIPEVPQRLKFKMKNQFCGIIDLLCMNLFS